MSEYGVDSEKWVAALWKAAENSELNNDQMSSLALEWMLDCPFRICAFLAWASGTRGAIEDEAIDLD